MSAAHGDLEAPHHALRIHPSSFILHPFILLLLFLTVSGCSKPRMIHLTGGTMGTIYSIKYIRTPHTPRGLSDEKIAQTVDGRLDRVNALMSTYIANSELSRFNAHRDASPFPVSEETLQVFQIARRVSDLSGGAFDVTVGPVVNAYGFGPDPETAPAPTETEIEALLDRVGYKKILIDPESKTLAKKHPGLYCDLSAVAKGYGVDSVAETLEGFGIENYMVEIGGEVRAKGKNLTGVFWRIGVETPNFPDDLPTGEAGAATLRRVVSLENQSMATSGDYRNYREVDGDRVSHTIDPRTGRPIGHNLASVTVLHETCAMADALATAINVLGPEEGYAFAKGQGVAALLLLREADGRFTELATPDFPEE